MITIRIVTNPDRCHVSVDGRPVATFLYSNYSDGNDEQNKAHALHDAKAQCFTTLFECNQQKLNAKIDTTIVSK